MASWVYDEKFLTGMQFLLRTLSFTGEEDNDLERPTQDQEEQHTTMIDFKFPWGLKNSATTFQAAVKATNNVKTDQQYGTTTDGDSINGYLIFRVSPWWDPNNEAQRSNMVGCSNRKAVNFLSKYPTINMSMITKYDSSSSSRTLSQLGL
jgi:hypothetical protein